MNNTLLVNTGAANGIGKESAKRFASYGCAIVHTGMPATIHVFMIFPRAKVVIGDKDTEGGKKTVREIEQDGGCASSPLSTLNRPLTGQNNGRKAVFVKCDVLSWDEQVSMFETAVSKYGSVDIVVGIRTSVLLFPSLGIVLS